MRLEELKVIIDKVIERDPRNGELELFVPNGKSSVGPIVADRVRGCTTGFDWNSGRFFILTEEQK